MNYKICVRFFYPSKIDCIEKWLYEMQENGWRISTIFFNIFIFKRTEKCIKNFFVFTLSFGTKLFEVMYRENITIRGIFEGYKVPTFSFYQCFSVPLKYVTDMKEIVDKRLIVFLQYVKEKIIIDIFLLISFFIMSIVGVFEKQIFKIHYMSIPLGLVFLLLLVTHIKEYSCLKKQIEK